MGLVMTLSITVLSAIMLSVWLLKSYAECPFAECRYAECRSTKFYNIGTLMGTMNGGTTTSGTSFLTTTLFFRLSWISLLWRSWSQRLYVFFRWGGEISWSVCGWQAFQPVLIFAGKLCFARKYLTRFERLARNKQELILHLCLCLSFASLSSNI